MRLLAILCRWSDFHFNYGKLLNFEFFFFFTMYRARKFVPLFQVILRYYTCYINDHPSNDLSNLVNQVENCFVSSVCNLESIDLLDKIDLKSRYFYSKTLRINTRFAREQTRREGTCSTLYNTITRDVTSITGFVDD